MALSAMMACVVMALIVDCERAISARLQGILVVQTPVCLAGALYFC